MVEELLPPGADRRQVVLHLTQTFNEISAFIIKDEDGIKTKELIFILERMRRALSVIKIFKSKTKQSKLKSNVMAAIHRIDDAIAKLR